jgi:predicted MPP superfamily phosphohydrolase
MNLLRAFRYVRGVSRAVRRGDTFPPAGRVPAKDAPGGTTRTLLRHSRKELDNIEISEHVVPVRGLAKPVTILHLTDVHLRVHDAWVERLADVVRKERPDLVALTGDVVTRGWKPDAVDHLLGALPDAPLGRWAVMGNWEYWAGAPREVWEPILTKHDVGLLNNRVVPLDGFDLVGTDDLLAGEPDLPGVFAALRPEVPALLLTHSPGIFPMLAKPPVRLVLAGHTHGGQVRIPVLGPFFLPRGSGAYPWGWYEMEGVHLFVSRGLGWSVAPVRWRCPPEVARIRMVPA